MATSMVLIDPQDMALITLDWSDTIGSATLGEVSHTVPAPLVRESQVTDAASKISQVKVSGAKHGATYLIEGQSALSNGETVNRQFSVRCFNG